MDDLISRQAAYDVLTAYYHHKTDIQHMALREALNKVPSAERHGRWIPCSEQLPEEDTDVLITDEDGDIDIAHYEYNPWSEDPIVDWWNCEYRTYAVAWMPLPEPYEVETNG